MSLETSIEKLNKLGINGFENLKVNDQYIWPYVKNKIFGIIVNESNEGRRNRYSIVPSRYNIDRKKQASNINKEYDVLLFNFYRFEFDENYNIYDSRNKNLIDEMKKNDINYAEIVSYHEGEIAPDIYSNDDMYIMDDLQLLYILPWKCPKINRNYNITEINDIISTLFDINFNIIDYEWEFLKNINIYNSYIRNVLLKTKPKAIFINANVVRPHLILAAKEMGILVYEVQYAAIIPYHLGYDLNSYEYKFAPDGLFTWGKYWSNSNFLSSTIIDRQVIGFDKTKEMTNEKKRMENSILIISQDLFSKKFLEQAINFATMHPEITVYYKKHPAENIDELLKNTNISNLKLENRKIHELNYIYDFVVGINSTALFEMANVGNKIVILNDIMSNYMKDLISKGKALLVDDLTEEFDEIIKYKYHNIPEFFEYEPNIDFTKILNNKIKHVENEYLDEAYKINMENLESYYQNNPYNLIENLSEDFSGNEKIMTIVIPCYNVEKTIKRQFESIKRQLSFKKLEIIFVNDGSNDDTITILNSIKSENENVIVINNLNPSGNPSKPRNQGLEITKTEYVYFLDADDFLYGNTLDYALYQLMKNDVDFVKTGCLINNNGNVGKISVTTGMKKKKNDTLLYTNIFVYTHFFKTKFLNKNKIKFIEKSYEDLPFMAEVYSKSKKVLTLNMYSVVYQKVEGTESDVNSAKKLKDLLDQRLNALSHISNNNMKKFFRNTFMISYVVTGTDFLTLFNMLEDKEKDEYRVKMYELLKGCEKEYNDFKGLNEENVIEKIKDYKYKNEFVIKNIDIINGNLCFDITSQKNIEQNTTTFNGVYLNKRSTHFIIEHDYSNLKLMCKDYEDYVTLKDFSKVVVQDEKKIIEISVKDGEVKINEKNTDEVYVYIDMVRKNKKGYYFIVYIPNGDEELELVCNDFMLLNGDKINFSKNNTFEFLDKYNNKVPVYSKFDKYYFNGTVINFTTENNILNIAMDKSVIKSGIKRTIRTIDKKDRIISYLKKKR